MTTIYKTLHTCKQSFHQKLDRQMAIEEEKANLLLLVDELRKEHPAISARKLYKMINPVMFGRDAFEQMLLVNGYGVKKLKSYMRTTNSLGVTRFENLIVGLELTGVNHVYVSDITYYRIGEIFYYLTFITDLFSRKIKGFSVSKTLLTIHTTIPALRMIKNTLEENAKIIGCILHSDGGGQYFCRDLIDITKEMGMQNSMGYSVFENPHAERVNGIIKNEYLKHYAPGDYNALIKETKRAVHNYNDRPHQSLEGLSPNQFEQKIEKNELIGSMTISDYREFNHFDLANKNNIDLGAVKGKINGPSPQATPSPPLTAPKSTLRKDVYKVKMINPKMKNKCINLH
jgi:putative transposase